VKLLVTDADTRAALAATRALGRAHRVHVAGPARRSLAGASRFAAAQHRVADPLAAPEAFAGEIRALCASLGIELVLPVTDGAMLALAGAREGLAPARLLAAANPAYASLSDKHALAQLARDAGIETPRGGPVRGPETALALARELGFPVVVKPVISVLRDAAGRLCKPEVVRVESAHALPEALARAGADGEVLLQECVAGWGEGLSLLRWQGRTLAAFAHRRLREMPPGGGVSVLSESIALDAQRLARVEALLDGVGYQGVAMAEFKSDGRRAVLIEVNARLWGSLQLAIDAGVDFPSLLVAAFGDARPAPAGTYRGGVRLRSEFGDLDHALALARGRGAPGAPAGLRAALAVLLRPAGPDCHWELLRREDPRPFLRALARWLARRPL
jgi:predicted ATP-grasp superfamily ATP-dependent carboligase